MTGLHPRLRAPERDTLEQFLDQHRAMVLAALDRIADADAAAPVLPHTEMTIGGIVKHLAQMEDLWFTHKFAGAPFPPPWPEGAEEGWAWRSAADDTVVSLRELYAAACDRSRAVAARHPDLDEPAALPSFGKGPVSLRWVYVHLLRETAQHRGHLDLMLDVLRERGEA